MFSGFVSTTRCSCIGWVVQHVWSAWCLLIAADGDGDGSEYDDQLDALDKQLPDSFPAPVENEDIDVDAYGYVSAICNSHLSRVQLSSCT